ncbi:MAG TPA: hypothetical protein VHK70_07415 [Burkholderiaceae bacterium]|nr:hypothetical protein [Burkholderiaceae bacterium]
MSSAAYHHAVFRVKSDKIGQHAVNFAEHHLFPSSKILCGKIGAMEEDPSVKSQRIDQPAAIPRLDL